MAGEISETFIEMLRRKVRLGGKEDNDQVPNEEDMRVGALLVSVGLLTNEQRNSILFQQKEKHKQGLVKRFGTMVLEKSLCTQEQIDMVMQQMGDGNGNSGGNGTGEVTAIPAETHDPLGARMIAAGLITPEQRDELLVEQHKLKIQGSSARFGELAVQKDYCTQAEVDAVIEAAEERKKSQAW